jgi:hypothetical protein
MSCFTCSDAAFIIDDDELSGPQVQTMGDAEDDDADADDPDRPAPAAKPIRPAAAPKVCIFDKR